jgi:hypothetical protein
MRYARTAIWENPHPTHFLLMATAVHCIIVGQSWIDFQCRLNTVYCAIWYLRIHKKTLSASNLHRAKGIFHVPKLRMHSLLE